jgi:hypothetical protein
MSERNWKMMERLHSHDLKDQVRRKVFSGSMCDVFDKNAPIGQRERLSSALTKIDPPVLKIIDPPSAQFLRFMHSDFS